MDRKTVAWPDRRDRSFPDPGNRVAAAFHRLGRFLRRYHRHHVRGFSYVREALAEGPVVLVGNHCMDVADPLMFATTVQDELGVPLRFIGHEILFFRLPQLRTLSERIGTVPAGRMDLADDCLRQDGVLMLYPGSGTEAGLRSYRREPYRLKWYGRLGFLQLALRHRATLLFVAGIGIDELYYQTDLPVPHPLFGIVGDPYVEMYRGLRIQLGLAGLHVLPAVFPLPVRVTHVVSPPIELDGTIDPDDRAALEPMQIRIWGECQAFLNQELAVRDRDSDWLDQACRATIHFGQRLGI